MINKITKDTSNLSSSRTYDDINNNLHVENNILTKEGIASYLGKELTGWEDIGLDPKKIYKVYRSKKILDKYKDIFNRLQVTREHPSYNDCSDIPKNQVIGATGEKAVVELNDNGVAELKNSITFWDNQAVDDVKNDKITGLSCGTILKYEKNKGQWNGESYDLVVSEMIGNHLALTDNPRIKGSVVADTLKINKYTGGIFMNLFDKFFGSKLQLKATKDSMEMIDIVEDLLEKGEHQKAMDIIKKMKESTTEIVEPTTDEKEDLKSTKDEGCDKTTKDEQYLTKKDMEDWADNKLAGIIGEILKKRDYQEKAIQDEESKNKQVAQDCADKIGLGKINAVTSDSMFRQILKSQNIPVYDSMNQDVMKGIVLALSHNSNSKIKDSNIVTSDSIENIPSDIVNMLGVD